uniref:RNase H domain-containing protein n=1 Tax=Strongyloides papillosus TaxID=174720 RepID=A0A0N5BG32_STREA
MSQSIITYWLGYNIKNSSKVYSTKKVTLLPYSSNIIHCELQTNNFSYENGYFTVNDTFRKDNLLLTCNQTGNIHDNMYAVLVIYEKQSQVYTDHKQLLALIKNKKLKEILEKVQLAIMEIDVKINYVRDPDNHKADYLSR